MNTHQTLSALLVAVFFLVSPLIKAQDFSIDLKKLEKSYSADFAKPFKITFANAPAKKANVAIKVGIDPFKVGDTVDLKNFSISFNPEKDKITFTDKDKKKQSIAKGEFKLQIDDVVAAIKPTATNPAPVNPEAAKDIIVDLTKDTAIATTFTKQFSLSFKGADSTHKELQIADGESRVSFPDQDLTKLKIDFIQKDGVLTIVDKKGKEVMGDDKKPFKIDDSDFDIIVGEKKIRVSDTTKIVVDTPNGGDKDAASCGPLTIIDASMFAAVNLSGCQLCDIRKKEEYIDSKKDRNYSTDYIVIYDPLLKKDAYTICKHVIKRNRSSNKKQGENFVERYIKVRPKMFAPHVGSQIRFEVVNLPLNSTMRLSVDEQDVFNGGASQFSNIISSLVSANIITPITEPAEGATPEKGEPAIHGTNLAKCFLPNLDQLASDVLKYMTTFRLSSCAVEKHLENLPVIFKRISDAFGISAASSEQLYAQLSYKIDKEVANDKKVDAMKKVQLIVNALKAMEDIKPLAFTTLRAKNRDYIEIKYADGSGTLSKPENIRMSGGMKIDFSAGFVLTGLKDHSYVLKNISHNYTPPGLNARDTTGNVIVKEDEGGSQVGVGLLTHFYPRISSHYNFGGTFGLMTSTSLNLRLMLGGSFMVSSLFGSNNRVSFSGGVVWGKVKRISEKDKDYFNHPRTVNGIPEFYTAAAAPEPIDRTSRSWFFAITMNFGGQ